MTDHATLGTFKFTHESGRPGEVVVNGTDIGKAVQGLRVTFSAWLGHPGRSEFYAEVRAAIRAARICGGCGVDLNQRPHKPWCPLAGGCVR